KYAIIAAAARRLATRIDHDDSACSTGGATNVAVTMNPNWKTTKSRSTPKPDWGWRSTWSSRRATIPPSPAKTRRWTHVNMSTISTDTGDAAGVGRDGA